MSEKETREIILDVAERLFYGKGYEVTSMSQIQKEAGIARGTLYYHFESKEDILDEVIRRQGDIMFANAKKISQDKSLDTQDRLIKTLLAMSASNGQKENLEEIHTSPNALLHQKINNYIVENATPFLTYIIEDGIKEGIFKTEVPKYAMEMVLIYINVAFDHTNNYSQQDQMDRFQALSINIHRLLGAEPGIIDFSKLLKEVIND